MGIFNISTFLLDEMFVKIFVEKETDYMCISKFCFCLNAFLAFYQANFLKCCKISLLYFCGFHHSSTFVAIISSIAQLLKVNFLLIGSAIYVTSGLTAVAEVQDSVASNCNLSKT